MTGNGSSPTASAANGDASGSGIAGLRFAVDTQLDREAKVLLGGAPLTALRLSAAGVGHVANWIDGATPGTPTQWRLANRLIELGMAHPVRAESSVPASSVTVVIPVLDDSAGLLATIASLNATAPQLAHIVVVDDGSTPAIELPDRIALGAISDSATSDGATSDSAISDSATSDTPVTLVHRETPTGPAAARNAGFAHVDTSIVAFVDANVTVAADWLPRLTAEFNDPDLAAVAPRIRSRVAEGATAAYDRIASPLDLGPSSSLVGPGRRITWVPTACLLIRSSALTACDGPFDESLRFGEDVDLVWRLIDAGHRVRYAPDVAVEHQPRTSLRDLWSQRLGYGSAAAPLASRYGSRLAPAVVPAEYPLAALLAIRRRPRAAAVVAFVPTVRTAIRLVRAAVPLRAAVARAGTTTQSIASSAGRAAVSTYWPIALVTCALSAPARRTLMAFGAGALVRDRVRTTRAHRTDHSSAPTLAAWLAHRVADLGGYGTGVWVGCLRTRNFTALKPRIFAPIGQKHQEQSAG